MSSHARDRSFYMSIEQLLLALDNIELENLDKYLSLARFS